MTDERRGSPRHTAHLAGELEGPEGKTAIAITRDVSAGGLLLFTRARLEVGAEVRLKIVHGTEQLEIRGKVLRQASLDPEESTLWRTKVALQVDDPILAQLYAALPEAT